MTIPRQVVAATQRLTDVIREMVPNWRPRMTTDEAALGVHLRGNLDLYDALTRVIRARIAGRALVPEPSEPLVAKSMIARDRELQWLLGRLEFVFNSPVNETEDREQPA